MTTRASPAVATTSRIAAFSTPSGSSPPLPDASLRAGIPNSITAPTPAAAASSTAASKLVGVCCTTPGMLAIGVGSLAPSRTKSGCTS